MPLRCDAIAPPGATPIHRAVDVEAAPEVVFRWLCQLRAAPYSYDLIDNRGRRSPQSLTPGLERLEAGQRVMRIFSLESFEPGRSMTLQLIKANGPFGDIAGTYTALPRGEAGSRLLVRLLWAPRRFTTTALAAGDWVMMRRQLLNLKALAEQT